MVLHRPVELAALIGQVAVSCRVSGLDGSISDGPTSRSSRGVDETWQNGDQDDSQSAGVSSDNGRCTTISTRKPLTSWDSALAFPALRLRVCESLCGSTLLALIRFRHFANGDALAHQALKLPRDGLSEP